MKYDRRGMVRLINRDIQLFEYAKRRQVELSNISWEQVLRIVFYEEVKPNESHYADWWEPDVYIEPPELSEDGKYLIKMINMLGWDGSIEILIEYSAIKIIEMKNANMLKQFEKWEKINDLLRKILRLRAIT